MSGKALIWKTWASSHIAQEVWGACFCFRHRIDSALCETKIREWNEWTRRLPAGPEQCCVRRRYHKALQYASRCRCAAKAGQTLNGISISLLRSCRTTLSISFCHRTAKLGERWKIFATRLQELGESEHNWGIRQISQAPSHRIRGWNFGCWCLIGSSRRSTQRLHGYAIWLNDGSLGKEDRWKDRHKIGDRWWIGWQLWRMRTAACVAELCVRAEWEMLGDEAVARHQLIFAPSYLEIEGWCGFRDRATHGLTEAHAKELVNKLRQVIGPNLDSVIARVGAMRVGSAKNSRTSFCKLAAVKACPRAGSAAYL